MQNKSSNEPNKNFAESIKDRNKNITCKDGFCFIPNPEGSQSINKDNINIFDPI